MHATHPLVLAALAEASGGACSLSATVKASDDAPGKFRAYAGRRALLRLVKLTFDGADPTELFVPVAVLESGEVLETYFADLLLRGSFRDLRPSTDPSFLLDVIEATTAKTLFSLQAAIEPAEQARFEHALLQARRFAADRLRVLEKRQQAASEELRQARLRLGSVAGAEAKAEAELAVLAAEATLAEIEQGMAHLQGQNGASGERQESAQTGRYTPPRVEHLFDLALLIE